MPMRLLSVLHRFCWSIPSSDPRHAVVAQSRSPRASSGTYMQPAKGIIERLGGPKIVSEITGSEISRVYRWMYPTERGGTGGHVPDRQARKLLDYAGKSGVPLTAADFFASHDPAPGGSA